MTGDETTGGQGSDAAPTRAAEAVGSPRQIGPYTIIRAVGRGGMSVVYLAHDPRSNRDVALKVIPSGPEADPVDLARFRTEAEAVERLDHPNIVHLYEVGSTDDVAYLAMEYVDGGTLYKKIKDGRTIDPPDAAKLVEQIARAIHYAHEHGVIHRDLKPSNILLLRPPSPLSSPPSEVDRPGTGDGMGTPKVADFGLARQLDRSLRLTRAGTAVGTPHYMAPEQARGEPAIGPALDIHGLGAILYELLTGMPPYMGNSPAETMEQVVHKMPTRPGELRQGIAPDLEAICMKCLEKEPRKRYRTAAALADDLRRFLEAPTDTTRFMSIRERPRSRRRTWLTTGAVILLLAAVSATTAYITWRISRSEIQAIRQQAEAAARGERRAKLDSAIALCQRGDVRLGLEQLRALAGDPDFPIQELIDAWQGRLLETVATIPDLTASVAAMSPHGHWLATADGNRVGLRKSADWLPAGDSWEVPESVTALGWSEDETHVAIGTVNGSVYVGNVGTGKLKPAPVVAGKGRAIAAVGFTFTGVRVIYSGNDLRQEHFPPLRATVKKADPPKFEDGPFSAVAMEPWTGHVAVATAQGHGRLFDANGRYWGPLEILGGDVSATAFAFDGNVLAIGNRQGDVQLWDVVTHFPLLVTATVGGPVRAVAIGYSETTYTVVACREDGAAVVLRCPRPWVGPPILLKNQPGNEALGVAFSGDGSKLFVTSPYGITLWRVLDAKRYGPERDYSSSDRFGVPPGPAASFSAPAAMGENGSFIVGGSGGKIFHLDRDGNPLQTAKGEQEMGAVTAVNMGPRGQICTASRHLKAGRVVVRHWAKGMDADPELQELNTSVNQEAFLPDGSAVVLACADGKVRVWEPANKVIRSELDCGSPVLCVAVSRDGRRIIAGCADGTAQVMDLATGGAGPVFRHHREVRSVAFVGDEVLTAGADNMCRRWHLATGLQLGPTMFNPDGINSLAVWNKLVATASRQCVRVWRLD